MRSRTGPCILAPFWVLHARLVAAGLRPQLQRLDNECSAALKQFLHDAKIDFQPPAQPTRLNVQFARSKITLSRDSAVLTSNISFAPVGQIIAPSRINPQPPARLAAQPVRLGACPDARHLRFEPYALGATRNPRPRPHQTQ